MGIAKYEPIGEGETRDETVKIRKYRRGFLCGPGG